MQETPYSFKVKDHRQYQPIGYRDKNGKTLILTFGESVSISAKSYLLTKPNIVSLFLSKSHKEFKKGMENKVRIRTELERGEEGDSVTTAYFDCLESLMNSVVNAYNAVEAIVNIAIPNDYLYRRENTRGIIEELSKYQIERWCSLNEKVNSILPQAFGIEPPNKQKFWERFARLEKIRNSIVHPKTYFKRIDLGSEQTYTETDDEFIQQFFDDSLMELLNSSADLVNYIINFTPPNESYPLIASCAIIIKDVNEFGDELFMVD